MTDRKQPLHYLDFLILSCIFFGYFSYVAIGSYFATPNLEPISAHSFSDNDNWGSIVIELCLLAISVKYLFWRKFDFSRLNFSINRFTLPICFVLIITGALSTDLVLYGGYYVAPTQEILMENPSDTEVYSAQLSSHISLSLVLFALLNGFFEELYFMGLTFAVKEEHKIYAVITSIFVRFIFHIYQGLWSAFSIAVAGVVYILFRQKIKSITPFILAHAFFDVFGAGILSFLL